MAQKLVKYKTGDYGVIQRGCSFMIPVQVKNELDEPLDLTGYSACFTAKKVKTDFDRDDDFAYIKKDITIQNPTQGLFYIELTSYDTDFEPGDFYFDIEIIHDTNGMVWRLCTLNFKLDGGPSNRFVNKGIGQLPTGDMISVITLSEGAPIVVIAPTLSLDSAVFAQVATLMGKVEALTSKIEALEEEHESCAQTHQGLRDDIDDIKEALGM